MEIWDLSAETHMFHVQPVLITTLDMNTHIKWINNAWIESFKGQKPYQIGECEHEGLGMLQLRAMIWITFWMPQREI